MAWDAKDFRKPTEQQLKASTCGTGRPANNPRPVEAMISSREACAIGSASVEPYTETISACGATSCSLSSSRGNTGAPPVKILRNDGNGRHTSRSKNAGDAAVLVGRYFSICANTGSGEIAPGRRKSASGSRLVTPDARFDSTNTGNVVKSTSPATSPNVAASTRCCAIKNPCVRNAAFGCPVLPLVNVSNAGGLINGGSGVEAQDTTMECGP